MLPLDVINSELRHRKEPQVNKHVAVTRGKTGLNRWDLAQMKCSLPGDRGAEQLNVKVSVLRVNGLNARFPEYILLFYHY